MLPLLLLSLTRSSAECLWHPAPAWQAFRQCLFRFRRRSRSSACTGLISGVKGRRLTHGRAQKGYEQKERCSCVATWSRGLHFSPCAFQEPFHIVVSYQPLCIICCINRVFESICNVKAPPAPWRPTRLFFCIRGGCRLGQQLAVWRFRLRIRLRFCAVGICGRRRRALFWGFKIHLRFLTSINLLFILFFSTLRRQFHYTKTY